MTEILITPREIPTCECGSRSWNVSQRICRDSDLIRVDGFGDLLVKTPDPLTSHQQLVVTCLQCKKEYDPPASTEAWHEGGGEDGYGWGERTANNGGLYE